MSETKQRIVAAVSRPGWRWAGPGRGSITDNINNFQHNVILPSCAAMLPPPTSNTLAVFILSQHFVYYSTISAQLIHSTIQIKSTHWIHIPQYKRFSSTQLHPSRMQNVDLQIFPLSYLIPNRCTIPYVLYQKISR